MADALAQGADTVITQGATQSNTRGRPGHRGETRLQCHLISRTARATGTTTTELGQRLLDQLLGAQLSEVAAGTDMDAAMTRLAARLRDDGRRPYVIPVAARTRSVPWLRDCALELRSRQQRRACHRSSRYATGSAGTQAGWCRAGRCAGRHPGARIGVRAPRVAQEEKVFNLAAQTADLLGAAGAVQREAVVANCDYVGAVTACDAGHDRGGEAGRAQRSILLDPVYSGKAMAGLIDLVRKGSFSKGTTSSSCTPAARSACTATARVRAQAA